MQLCALLTEINKNNSIYCVCEKNESKKTQHIVFCLLTIHAISVIIFYATSIGHCALVDVMTVC